jgi:spore coat-associated protein N
MQRISALWQASPSKLLGALLALALAAMMAVASGATFTSTSANAGNIVTAGVLSQANSKAPGAVLNVSGLAPGHSDSGTVTITNTGDVAGVFTLGKSDVVDSDAANPLSSKLDLVVTDVTTSTPVYSGKLGAMGARPAGTLAPGASRTYDFTVTFPDGGVPAGPTSGDNAYKGDDVTVDYLWESVSD